MRTFSVQAYSVATFLALCGCMLPGCLISSHSGQTAAGRVLTTEDIRSIEIGKTTGAEMLKSFGGPTERIDRPDGSATWKWCRTETRTSSGAVLLVFGGSSSSSSTSCTVIDLANDVVTQVRSE